MSLAAEEAMTGPAADPGAAAPAANGEAPAPTPLALAEEPRPELPAGPPPPTAIVAGEAPATPVFPKTITQLAPAEGSPLPPADALTLEERVRRLEDAMAQIQDVRGIETRVAERVAVRLTREPPAAVGGNATGGPPGAGPEVVSSPAGEHRRWLFRETMAEGRAIVRMFLDPRYRLSWFTRILALALAAAILTSGFWVPLTSIPIFGTLFDKVIDLALAFVLFKVLGHEARRYRATSPDLPPALRL